MDAYIALYGKSVYNETCFMCNEVVAASCWGRNLGDGRPSRQVEGRVERRHRDDPFKETAQDGGNLHRRSVEVLIRGR